MSRKKWERVQMWKRLISGTISLSLFLSFFPISAVNAYDIRTDRSANALKEWVEKYNKELQDSSAGVSPIKDGVDVSTEEYQSIIIEFKSLPRITANVLKEESSKYSLGDEIETEHKEFSKFLAGKAKEKSSETYEIEHSYYDTFNGVAMKVRGTDISMLLESGVVKSIWKDEEVRVDPEIKSAKSIEEISSRMVSSTPLIGVDKLRKEGITGKGIKVGVLDTGIDYNHPDLKENYRPGGYDYVNNDEDPMETTYDDWSKSGEPEKDDWGNNYYTSHGTHVSGTIGANGKNSESEFAVTGIAPDVELYAYKVLGPYGVGSSADIIAAIEQSVKDGMDVINLSLGITTPSPLYPSSIACNNAAIAGVVPVVANGNSGPGASTLGSPGTSPLSISVGASTTNISIDKFKLELPDGNAIDGELIARPFDSIDSVVGNEYEIIYGGFGFDYELSELDVKGKVLFVDRGYLSFAEKFINAKNAGAVALILANNVPGEIGLFFGEGTDRVLGIGISQENGKVLKEALGIATTDSKEENLEVPQVEDKQDSVEDIETTEGQQEVEEKAETKTEDQSTVEVEEEKVKEEKAGAIVENTMEATAVKSIKIEFNGKTSTNGDELADFSSRGPSSDETIKPDITAPGVGIFSTYPEYINSPEDGIDYSIAYSRIDGTSMASPHVAGVAALMLQNNKDLTPEQIKVAIMNNAEKLTKDYGVNEIGAGRINAYEAVNRDIAIKVLDKCESLDEDYKKIELPYITGSLSFDRIAKGEEAVSKSLAIQMINSGEKNKTFDVDVQFLGESTNSQDAVKNGVTLEIPNKVTLEAGETVDIKSEITVPGNSAVGRYEGFVVFTNTEDPAEDYRVPFAVKYLTPGVESVVLSRPAMSNDLEMMHFAKIPGLSAMISVSSPISTVEVYVRDYETKELVGLSSVIDISYLPPGYSDNIVALDSRAGYFPIDKDGNMDMVRSSLKDGKYILEFVCNDAEKDAKYTSSYNVLVDNEDVKIKLDKEPGVYEVSENMYTEEEYSGETFKAYWLHGNVTDNSIEALNEMGYKVDTTSIQIAGFVNGMPYYGIPVDNQGNFKIGIQEEDLENGIFEVSPMPIDIATSQNLYMPPRYFFIKEGTPYHSVTLDKDEMSLGENINATISVNNVVGSSFKTTLNFFKAFEVMDVRVNAQLQEFLDKNGYEVKIDKRIFGYSTRELGLNIELVDKDGNPVNIPEDMALVDVELKLAYDAETEFYKEYIQCQGMEVKDAEGNPVDISYNGTYEGVKIKPQTSTLKTFQLAEGFYEVSLMDLYNPEFDKYIWIEDSKGNKYDLTYDEGTGEYDNYNLPITDEEMMLVTAMPGHFKKTAKFIPSRMIDGELIGKVYYLLGAEFYKNIFGGDATEDGVIDIHDALDVEKYYGQKVDYSKVPVDFNFDGVVDVYDMDYIVYNFEQYNEQVLDRKDPELSYDGRTLEDILEAVGYHEEVRLEEMTIDKTSIFLNVGETDKITATITPENVTGVSLIWKSSNEKVVTVDSEGNVTAVAPGSTRVIVKTSDNRLALSCYISVGIDGEVPEIEDVIIEEPVREVYVGYEFELNFKVEPYESLVDSAEYISSANSIVSVDENGKAVANKVGKAFVSVNIDGTSIVKSWEINVVEKEEEIIPLESIKLSKNKLNLNKSEEAQLEVTFKPEDATNKNVKWSSSDERVATVIDGKVVAIGKGEAVIAVISEEGEFTDTCKVTVKEKEIEKPEKPEKPSKPNKPNLPQTGAMIGSTFVLVAGLATVGAGLFIKRRKRS